MASRGHGSTINRRGFIQALLGGTAALALPRIALGDTAAIKGVSALNEGDKLAPGGWAQLYPTGLDTEQLSASEIPLPSSLGTVSLTVQGRPAALNYVSSSQINLQIPCELQPGLAEFVINNGGAYSKPMTVNIAQAAPSIFRTSANIACAQRYPDNSVLGLGTNLDGYLTKAALGSDIFTVYLTGLPIDGKPMSTGAPAGVDKNGKAYNIEGVDVLVDGNPLISNVAWSPSLVGVQQSAVQIPQDLERKIAQLTISARGITSTAADFPVAANTSPLLAGRIITVDGKKAACSLEAIAEGRAPERLSSSEAGNYIGYLPGRPQEPQKDLANIAIHVKHPAYYDLNTEVPLDTKGNATGKQYMIPIYKDPKAHFRFLGNNPREIPKGEDISYGYFVADPTVQFDLLDFMQYTFRFHKITRGNNLMAERWPEKPEPIKIFLDREHAPKAILPILNHALEAWDFNGHQRFIEVPYDPTLGKEEGGAHVTYNTQRINTGGVISNDFEVKIGEVDLDVTNPSYLTVNVLMHELGHVHGLPHSPDPDSVMFARMKNFPTLVKPELMSLLHVEYR